MLLLHCWFLGSLVMVVVQVRTDGCALSLIVLWMYVEVSFSHRGWCIHPGCSDDCFAWIELLKDCFIVPHIEFLVPSLTWLLLS